MPLNNDNNPITIRDLDDLDERITAVVRKTQQELLSEVQRTKLEVERLRREVDELKEQVPPKLKTL
jgi:peptidoglycan hydrolase CwlO-like protein